ncbi:hypothetical protein [Flagellimonas myxillae]|uniref:hypothetical protein n=1 Tax=Flagellimonas myxillae TaxID=2942214 RepID=UPI00201F8D85|nr:hypothetical protein [Muricauda myxillae]MCL6265744.1 hypothetical protein [Muricauda myxillae]
MKYLLVLLLFGISVHGQERSSGTIYLSNGTVLPGFVEFSRIAAGIQKKNPRVFYWGNETSGKKQTFKAVEVDSVTVKHRGVIYAIPVDKKCKKLFFKVLINGKHPLVCFNMVHIGGPLSGFYGGRSTEFWLWKKSDNKAYPLKTIYSDHSAKSYKRKAREFMYECPSLATDYSNKEMRNMEAVELYSLYNNCIN